MPGLGSKIKYYNNFDQKYQSCDKCVGLTDGTVTKSKYNDIPDNQ